MEAIALNNVTYTEEPHKTERKTCEYCGDDYPILTNMKGKYFIEVDGERKYLDKNGKVINKQRGTKSIKTAIENFEDMKKIQNYFIEHNQWNFYLLFTLNANTGRRISDLRQALWSDFFYKNGSMKKFWNIKKLDEDDQRIPGEQKTGKSKELLLISLFKKHLEFFSRMKRVLISNMIMMNQFLNSYMVLIEVKLYRKKDIGKHL
ncbi:hypothetical protein C823_007842 [Eubacterium plexicaudatum ASF492]|nr:hypothetical protein C823_007842 [Eubacterium plexicaudatum ASF492]